MPRFTLLAASVAVVVASLAVADPPKAKDDPNVHFLTHCGNSCLLIHEVSDYAVKTSNQPNVKELARKLSDEHKEMHKGMAKVAGDIKVVVVNGSEKAVREEVARLGKLKGYDLDREYLKKMAEEHDLMTKHFDAAAADGNEKIKAFVNLTRPKLKAEIDEIRALRATLPVK